MEAVKAITAEFPAAFTDLFRPARYKCYYGGRGAGKSQNFARALLILAARQKLRILCTREVQKSIRESVHRLLSEQIIELGLQGYYEVTQSTILGSNGSEFIFSGLKNSAALKSTQGVQICWCEEAASISRESWDLLLPTVRAENSEIWISMNPILASDNSYKRWVLNPPPDAIVRKVNFDANPWFPEVLRKEMEHCRATDPDGFNHIWLGSPVNIMAGAIYGNELRAVEAEGRITRIPVDHTRPIHTSWDLGWADYVSIWLFQVFPFEYRIVDFIEGNRQNLAHYLKVLQSKGYLYGTDYLPHDARAHSLGTGKSIEELMRAAGRKVVVVAALKKADQLNAVRTILPQCYFDNERCEDGLQHLRHYKYGEQKTLGTDTREPLHDEHSHAADAFVQFAVGVKQPKKEQPKTPVRRPPVSVWS